MSTGMECCQWWRDAWELKFPLKSSIVEKNLLLSSRTCRATSAFIGRAIWWQVKLVYPCTPCEVEGLPGWPDDGAKYEQGISPCDRPSPLYHHADSQICFLTRRWVWQLTKIGRPSSTLRDSRNWEGEAEDCHFVKSCHGGMGVLCPILALNLHWIVD